MRWRCSKSNEPGKLSNHQHSAVQGVVICTVWGFRIESHFGITSHFRDSGLGRFGALAPDSRPRSRKQRTATPQGRKTADGHLQAENDGRPPLGPKTADGRPPRPKTADGRPQMADGHPHACADGRPLFGAAVRGWGSGRPSRPRADGHP